MEKNDIFQSLKSFFQRKHRVPDRETLSARRDWNEVFSYTIGEPDDEETREAFRLLREWRQQEQETNELAKDDNEQGS